MDPKIDNQNIVQPSQSTPGQDSVVASQESLVQESFFDRRTIFTVFMSNSILLIIFIIDTIIENVTDFSLYTPLLLS
jgi:hypothetical protein